MALPMVQDWPALKEGVRRGRAGPDLCQMADPLFILAPPRSFSSVVCAMLGQHPQMHGLPETHLFSDETLEGWWGRCSQVKYLSHGLLRAVAELCFGEQTRSSVKLASGWLRRRSSFTSGMIFEELALEIYPSILVDKSPSIVYSVDSMHRAYRFFPQSRFIHLVRHPRGHAESVLKYLHRLAKLGHFPQWVSDLASFPHSSPNLEAGSQDASPLDPQRAWYVLNLNIVTFLKSVPSHQWMTIRGEDLLADPDRGLQQIIGWIGLSADDETIEEMKHPERSPYARFGPPEARCGNDIFFLESPAFHPARVELQSLEGPLSWRPDGQGFLPAVRELAQHFGYQ